MVNNKNGIKTIISALMILVLATCLSAVAPAFVELADIPITKAEGSYKAYAAKPKISAKNKTLLAGKSVTLRVKNVGKQKITWKSSSKKVATVNKKGKVVAKKMGTTTITAKVGRGKKAKSLKCKITVKPYMAKTNLSIYEGESIFLSVRGASGAIRWSSSNTSVIWVYQDGEIVANGKGTATVTARVGKYALKCNVTVLPDPFLADQGSDDDYWDWGEDPEPVTPGTDTTKDLVSKVSSYSYKITPVNTATNAYIFVETDNPDPMSFQFRDSSSKYTDGSDPVLFKPYCFTFVDVNYTDKKTRRISNKGYLFWCQSNESDGGTLGLLANNGYYFKPTGWGYEYNDGVNYETGKTVSCAAMTNRVDYLIKTYAGTDGTLFDKLDRVQSALDAIALYPKSVLDSSKPNASWQYPCLATSPYPELDLNKHIETMFEDAEDGVFLNNAYGFVLDSLGVPGTMSAVAEKLEPKCTISDGWSHAFVNVSFNGQEKQYGGAGAGGSQPLYSKFIDWQFRFDGTDIDFGTKPSLETMKATRVKCTNESNTLADLYLDQISNKALFKVMGDGTWIRCAVEGWGGGVTVCYISASSNISYAAVASDAWVDGRYVNNLERWVPGKKFADYPKADIILKNVQYNDGYDDITGTVTYTYCEKTDDWRAEYYYHGPRYSSADFSTIAPNLVLSREKVEQLVASGEIDGKTDVAPKQGYIFDGSAEPGTYTDELTH